MKTKRNTFSRLNQPVPCRICGKSTTWSESNGNRGLDLCGPCFERAGLENDHFDNGHDSAVAGCPQCEKAAAAAKVKVEAIEPTAEERGRGVVRMWDVIDEIGHYVITFGARGFTGYQLERSEAAGESALCGSAIAAIVKRHGLEIGGRA